MDLSLDGECGMKFGFTCFVFVGNWVSNKRRNNRTGEGFLEVIFIFLSYH